MKNLLIILGFIILTSATTVSVMTVKPIQPKYTCTRIFSYETECVTWLNKMTKKGYIIKHYTMSQFNIIATIEKY